MRKQKMKKIYIMKVNKILDNIWGKNLLDNLKNTDGGGI